jgi:FolB domain-containing protein
MDRIIISDLSARCVLGIGDEERREKQDVIANIVLFADLREAGQTDRFENALDYRELKKRVLRLIESSNFFLVEALAEAIAAVCLENGKVITAQVRVDKPMALRFARSVGVEITRTRED